MAKGGGTKGGPKWVPLLALIEKKGIDIKGLLARLVAPNLVVSQFEF